MLRRIATVISFGAVATLMSACATGTSDEPGAPLGPTAEVPLGESHPFVLLPTAPDVARVCAAELGVTYCTDGEATAAAERCRARLEPGASACGADCTRTYAPDRKSCRAGATYADRAACDKPVADDCAFYRSCLESAHPCGDDGYALAYGERLCYAFIEKRGAFSAEGQRWLRDVRSCLQRELVPVLHDAATASCTSILDEAYATHPGCYTAPGNSICALPLGDVVELAGILGNDLYSERARAQIHEVATTCLLELFGLSPSVSERSDPRHQLFSALEASSR